MTKKASVKLYKKLERRLTEKDQAVEKSDACPSDSEELEGEGAESGNTESGLQGDLGTGGRYDAPDISCAGGRMAFLYL